MINYVQIVIRQIEKRFMPYSHYLIEFLLGGGLVFSVANNINSESQHEKREKLVKNQLQKDQAIINDLRSKAQKFDKLEKCNELLMDALTKKSSDIDRA